MTLFTAGKVARFDAAAADGAAPEILTPSLTPFTGAFGIVTSSDGYVYVASNSSSRIARFRPDGSSVVYDLPPGDRTPLQMTRGVDEDVWYTNDTKGSIGRLTAGKPRAVTGAATVSGTTAMIAGTLDTRGNPTEVFVDYGTTTAYGRQSAKQKAAATVGPNPVSIGLSGLAPGTTYHYRLVAANADGSSAGADGAFTTAAVPPPPPPPPPKRLTAKASLSATVSRGRTRITKLRITGLIGGESVRVRCIGGKRRGCPFIAKTRRVTRRGTLNLDALIGKRRSLAAGVKIELTVTRSGYIGRVITFLTRARAKPRATTRCLRPAAKRSSAC